MSLTRIQRVASRRTPSSATLSCASAMTSSCSAWLTACAARRTFRGWIAPRVCSPVSERASGTPTTVSLSRRRRSRSRVCTSQTCRIRRAHCARKSTAGRPRLRYSWGLSAAPRHCHLSYVKEGIQASDIRIHRFRSLSRKKKVPAVIINHKFSPEPASLQLYSSNFLSYALCYCLPLLFHRNAGSCLG